MPEQIDTNALRVKWSDWADAALDPQNLRRDFFDLLDVLDALQHPVEPEWTPCCEHCGCAPDGNGHDDTCGRGCND